MALPELNHHLSINDRPIQYVDMLDLYDSPPDELMLFHLLCFQHPEVINHLFTTILPDSPEKLTAWYNRIELRGDIYILAKAREIPTAFGGIKKGKGDNFPAAEISYVVFPLYQKQGVGTNLAKVLLYLAAQVGYKHVYAAFPRDGKIEQVNPISIHMLQKLGFTCGTEPQTFDQLRILEYYECLTDPRLISQKEIDAVPDFYHIS